MLYLFHIYMADRPITIKIQEELFEKKDYTDSNKRCSEIVKEIQNLTKRRTITYFAAGLNNTGAFVDDSDAISIEDLLSYPSDLEGLDLILNSYGGSALAAERIVNVCRKYVQQNKIKEFRVVVPRFAKSAATMIALGADFILLCKNAELGPIDPQLILLGNDGKPFSKPGYQITKAVDDLLSKSEDKTTKEQSKYLNFLQQYNYDVYITAQNELNLSNNIALKLYTQKKQKFPSLKYKSFDIFTKPEKTLSHARLISIDDLKGNQLYRLEIIQDLNSFFTKKTNKLSDENITKLNELLWELYIRKNTYVMDGGNPVIKVIEDANYTFMSQNTDWKPLKTSTSTQNQS
ncbi:MAG: hypothetical protein Q8P26_01955 [Candidatus Levybacteria bacterium]|nr:hypothetical protein [Candidatus Levybacteria bacterium]